MANPENTVKTTNTSFDIIQFINSENGARLPELAAELDLSKSAVHSHLNTLRNRGYVEKTGEIYKLSLELFHLGQSVRNDNNRYQLAQKKTAQLADSLNHSIDFDVETNGRVMILFHEADESAEVGLNEGDYLSMHTSSTGKAILSELPTERVDEILDKWGMPAETERTITERSEFMSELERTRERGYAIINQEWLEGLRAVGVAVLQPNGEPFGALSVGGPMYRLTDEAIETEIAPKLREAATELEEEISTVYE